MNEPRLDLYPLDYDDTNHVGMYEFTILYNLLYNILHIFSISVKQNSVYFCYRKRRIFCI